MKKILSLITIILLLFITSCSSELEFKGRKLSNSEKEKLCKNLEEYISNTKYDYYCNWYSVNYNQNVKHDTNVRNNINISGTVFESANMDEYKAQINYENQTTYVYSDTLRTIQKSSIELSLIDRIEYAKISNNTLTINNGHETTNRDGKKEKSSQIKYIFGLPFGINANTSIFITMLETLVFYLQNEENVEKITKSGNSYFVCIESDDMEGIFKVTMNKKFIVTKVSLYLEGSLFLDEESKEEKILTTTEMTIEREKIGFVDVSDPDTYREVFY